MRVKILFVLPSLRSGGAERVMSFLAQHINASNFNVQLLVTGFRQDQKYEVANIPVTFLNQSRVKNAVPGICKHLFKHRPKIVISAIGHLNMALGLISFFFPSIKFVARETTISSFALQNNKDKKKKSAIIYKLALRKLDRIVCQSDDMKNNLIERYGIPLTKMIVINNPVTSKFRLKQKAFFEDGPIKLITVGRLTPSKGYERVLDVLAKLDTSFHYTIIGSGESKNNIQALIETLGLKESVTLVSYTDNVNDYLSQNDIFLQGSYVEGFPNALLESCATGTPAVVYDAPGGINEIILPGINGYVAKDSHDFLTKLKQAIKQDWDAKKIRDSVYSRYSEDQILKRYEIFFQELAQS